MWPVVSAVLAADPAAAPPAADPFVPLHSPAADSSSYLRSNWNRFTENYHANYVLDGDPATAWVEGVDGIGVGEWIGWRTSVVSGVHRVKLRVRNGYQKSASLLLANAAPRVITVELRRADRVVYAEPLTLERAMGWQEFVLDPPEDLSFDAVRLRIDEAVPGSTYADLCLSDVELLVDAETPWSGPFERSKQLALAAWIGDRKAAAKYFASQPKQYPFASTHFVASQRTPADVESFDRLASEALAAAAQLSPGDAPWRRVDGNPPRLPDGLGMPDVLARWLAPDRTFFEASGQWRTRRSDPDDGIELDALSNARVVLAPDGVTPTSAVFERVLVELGRSSGRGSERWWVGFDGDGRAASFVATWGQSAAGDCDGIEGAEAFDVTWDAGKIVSVRQRTRTVCENVWAGECEPGGAYEAAPDRDERCPDQVTRSEVLYTAAP